ncbi:MULTISPECIES: hypothetical protein [unclassified Moorena]|uniref:hypothetical protein n=1 Tax=unclassified Moorena TaxID=2683338 RepID=UPI0013C5EEFB|nr:MULTISPECIES: hypothetical protein [unclassified Moorena]NEO20433.1 hypothetical protein [Moorena sp. SIO4A5]NEQ59968.1 hypothetical protein [Moorena sp. SIO4A1]
MQFYGIFVERAATRLTFGRPTRSHFPFPCSRFPIPDSRFPIPDSLKSNHCDNTTQNPQRL